MKGVGGNHPPLGSPRVNAVQQAVAVIWTRAQVSSWLLRLVMIWPLGADGFTRSMAD